MQKKSYRSWDNENISFKNIFLKLNDCFHHINSVRDTGAERHPYAGVGICHVSYALLV